MTTTRSPRRRYRHPRAPPRLLASRRSLPATPASGVARRDRGRLRDDGLLRMQRALRSTGTSAHGGRRAGRDAARAELGGAPSPRSTASPRSARRRGGNAHGSSAAADGSPSLRALMARPPRHRLRSQRRAADRIVTRPVRGVGISAKGRSLERETGISPLYLDDGRVAYRTVAAIGGGSPAHELIHRIGAHSPHNRR